MKRILFILLLIPFVSNGQLVFNGFKHTSGGTGDADSAAYITAVITAGYTPTATEKTAVGRRISDYKGKTNASYSTVDVWTTSVLKADYPMLGSTAATHAINLRNPSAFTITWNGTVTHTANYYQGNGTTGYGNTGVNASTNLSAGQGTLIVYIKTLTAGDGVHDFYDIGASNGTNADLFAIDTSPDQIYGQMTDASSFPFLSSTPTAPAVYSLSATASNALNIYKNATSLSSYTTTRATTQPNQNFYIGAANISGTASGFSKNKVGEIIILNGTSSTVNTFIYNAVNAYNTALSK